MKSLNDMKTNDSRTAATRSFMQSYAIRTQLAEIDLPDEEAPVSADIQLCKRSPFHPFLEDGQIRLLSQPDALVYVLLLRRWSDNSYLVIPFSAYSDPATDLEYKVGMDLGGCLEVLQVWNARTLQDATLRQSWLTGYLDAEDCLAALSLWSHMIGGELPKASVIARTGLPVSLPNDVRLRYQEEILAEFAKLDTEDFQAAGKTLVRRDGESRRRPVPGRPLPLPDSRNGLVDRFVMAAADADRAITVMRTLSGFDGKLRIRYVPAEGVVNIRIYDASGNPSEALDGWAVLGPRTEVLGYVTGSSFEVRVKEDFDGTLLLLDLDGTPHEFEDDGE